MKHNPLLEIPDPYEGYKKSFEEKNEKNTEFQRLCFEVFHENKHGIELWKHIVERFLMKQLFDLNNPVMLNQCLYWEGVKEGMRGLYEQGRIHRERITGARQ